MTEATALKKFSCPACGGGVRPSSGAETDNLRRAPDSLKTLDLANVAAAGDGRTPGLRRCGETSPG